MQVCAVCCTYNRPHLLPYILWCFQRQTHRNRKLLILDDHDQYGGSQSGPDWVLHCVDDPQPTLGAKRRLAVELADVYFKPDVFAIWDDDEYYYPHALASLAQAARSGAWLRPGEVWHYHAEYELLTRHRTYGAADKADRAYQSGWGLRRDILEAGLLWPDESYTEDRALARKLLAAGVPEEDPLRWGDPPYVIYDPYAAPDRLSRQGGVMGWLRNLTARRGDSPVFAPLEPLAPPLPAHVLELPEGARHIPPLPRPWGPEGDWLERNRT